MIVIENAKTVHSRCSSTRKCGEADISNLDDLPELTDAELRLWTNCRPISSSSKIFGTSCRMSMMTYPI